MFKALVISNLMVWHSQNRSNNGLVQHVAISKTWAHIDATWPKFATKPHNVQLALAIDGVNPFSEKSNNWSSWLVLLFNYNFPPWFVTKHFLLCWV
jgi:hypothetical protein